ADASIRVDCRADSFSDLNVLVFSGIPLQMIQRRFALLATTAIALVPAVAALVTPSSAALAQTAPMLMAQAQTPPEGEKKHEGPPGKEAPK
ncbi:UNVERIFIED_CONTAM: hypothetical protein NY100_21250, partial [Prevotella sp. 15_C9]